MVSVRGPRPISAVKSRSYGTIFSTSQKRINGNPLLPYRVLLRPFTTAEVAERWNGVENKVNKGENNDDTERVSPNTDNGDNVGPASVWVLVRASRGARQPTKEGKDSGKSVDTENSANQLERWEDGATTSDENKPVLGKCDFKEENALDGSKVLDDTVGTLDDTSV